MDKQLKIRWLEALEGKAHKQGRSALKTGDNTFCCLGVLCDLVDPKGWDELNFFKYKGESRPGYPPEKLIDEIGLDVLEVDKLVDMNDSGQTFKQIARYIKENKDI